MNVYNILLLYIITMLCIDLQNLLIYWWQLCTLKHLSNSSIPQPLVTAILLKGVHLSYSDHKK